MEDRWNTDPLIQKLGGLLTPETTDHATNRLAGLAAHVFAVERDLLHQRDTDLGIDRIELLFVRTASACACAYHDIPGPVVVLSVGLLHRLFCHLALGAHLPTVLPLQDSDTIGNPFPPHAGFRPDLWDHWVMSADRVDEFYNIFTQMLAFVIDHELAHHIRGHLEIMKMQTGLSLISDDAEARERERTDFLLQDIEFDADAMALNNMLLSMDQKHPFDTWTPDEALEFGFQIAFAQLLVAQALDNNAAPTKRPGDRHPAPILRAINFTNLVFRSLHDLVPGDWEPFRDMHDTAWGEASALAEWVGLPDGRWHGALIPESTFAYFLTVEARYFAAHYRINQMRKGA